MKRNNLLILAIAALILVILAFIKNSKSSENKTALLISKKIFPEFPVNDITAIEISDANNSLQVQKKDNEWCIPSRFNYPVEFAKVRDILLKVSEMKIGQTVKLSEKQLSSLKLVKPATGVTNAGTFVRFIDSRGNQAASLLIGETRKKQMEGADNIFFGGYPDGQYISSDEGKNAYLISEPLFGFTPNAKEWFDAELLNIPSTEISEITITRSGKQDVTLKQNENGKMVVDGISKREETDDSKTSSTQSSLSFFRMDDIADPSLSDEETGMNNPIVFEAKTKKGEIYRVKIGKVNAESNYYVRLAMDLTPEAGLPPPQPPQSSTNATEETTNTQSQAAQKSERDDLEQKMTAFNNKCGRWTYLIASYKVAPMMYKRDDLVITKKEAEQKAKEQEKKEEIKEQKEAKKKKGFFPFWKK